MFNLYINELTPFLRSKGHGSIFINDENPNIICILLADDIANSADTAIELQLNESLNSVLIVECP